MGIKYKNVWDYYPLLINNFFVTGSSLPAVPGVAQRQHPCPCGKADASNNCMFEFISAQTQYLLHTLT